jgi:hypothetical protein
VVRFSHQVTSVLNKVLKSKVTKPFMYPTKFLLGMLGMISLEARRDRMELSSAVTILRVGMESPEY